MSVLSHSANSLIKEGKPLSPEEEEEAGMARESRRGEDEAGMGRERRLGEEETLKNEKKPFVDYREGTFSEGQRVSNGRGDEEPGMDRERRRDEGQPLKTEKKPFVGYREGTFYEGQEASTGRGEEGYGEEGGEYGREGRREPSIKKKPFVGYREGTFYQGEPATEKSQEKGREEEMTGRGQTGRRDQEAPDVGYRGSHFYPGKVSSHEMPQRKQQIGRDEEGWREWQETETQGAEESQRRMPREQDLGSRRAGESRQEQARALGEIAKTGRHLREEQQVPEEQEEFAMPPERFEGEEAAGAWEPSRYQKVTEYQRHPEKDTDQVGRRGGQEARGLKEEHATKAQWPYIPAEGHEEGPESIRRSVFGGMPGVTFNFIQM